MRESILTELVPIPRVEILHDTLSKNQILSPRCYGTKEKKHTPDLGGRVIERWFIHFRFHRKLRDT